MSEEIVIAARRALLDALEALGEHSGSLVLVGAQAIYLHTGSARVGIAEYTTDADLAVDARTLSDEPLIDDAMRDGGFEHPSGRNPGVWLSADGVQVDLMVPAAIAGPRRRSVAAPPHHAHSMRKSLGLEAALIDNTIMEVTALDPEDRRRFRVAVAGPSALLVAKLHKVGERLAARRAAENKDAHDIYRLLVAMETETLVAGLRFLLAQPDSEAVTRAAIDHLAAYFAAGAQAEGALMAGAAEQSVGEPEQVALATSLLAADVIDELDP